MVLTQQLSQLLAGRVPLFYLRTGYWYDQLGYLAITADVRNGHVGLTEPVTMTGVSHYPVTYYSAVGGLARVLGIEAVTAWNLLSLSLQFTAAVSLGVVAASVSRRWWLGALAAVPFLTGTFSYLHVATSWFTSLEAHAVLWGPFGVLFSNNAETAGVCVGILAITLAAWAWAEPRRGRVRTGLTIVAAASVGMLSGFQTYSFLTLTYLVTFGCAIAGLWLARPRARLVAVSLGLLVAVFLLGPLVADRLGQLPTLVFGLLPALPGLVCAVIRSRGLVAVAAGVAMLTAAPQVIYTALGIAHDDPFLTYRVESNHLLGVVSFEALTGAIVVLVPLVAAFVIGISVRDVWTVAVTGAGVFALPLLAVNDVWGANAEPYRFWIEALLFGGVLAALGLARLAGLLLVPRATRPDTADQPGVTHARRVARAALVATLVVSGLLWASSLPDWRNFMRDPVIQAVWNPGTERERAIAALGAKATLEPADGLLTTDLCIDNRTTKVTTGSPVANYHMGMAWPADRAAIDAIIAARNAGQLDFPAMAASNTIWVLTDSNCGSAWQSTYASQLELVASEDYRLAESEVIVGGTPGPDGTISLWRVADL